MQNSSKQSKTNMLVPKRRTWLSFLLRWIGRGSGGLLVTVLLFCLMAWVLGNTPRNTSFQHAGVESGIEIMVIDNGVHVDLVIPVDEPSFRWLDRLQPADFLTFDPTYRYAVLGWGNRQFYMETQTWADMKVSNVLYAFAGIGDTVVHVDLCGDLTWFSKGRKLRLSQEQFKKLSEYLLSSFKNDSSGKLLPIPDRHYRNTDAFYEGTGHYHLFRTCNVWAGDGLAKAGVRVGYWTLTPGLVFACLPESPPGVSRICRMRLSRIVTVG